MKLIKIKIEPPETKSSTNGQSPKKKGAKKAAKKPVIKPIHGLKVLDTNGVVSINKTDYLEDNKKLSLKENKDIQNKSIKKYDLEEFKKILTADNIWAIYKFGKSDWDLLVKDKTHYEGFVSGYLTYYDGEVRNGMSDHGVFFHWGQWKDDPYCCVIFLDPAPKTEALKYSNTTDRFGHKYFGQIKAVDSPATKASDPPKVPPPPPPY